MNFITRFAAAAACGLTVLLTSAFGCAAASAPASPETNAAKLYQAANQALSEMRSDGGNTQFDFVLSSDTAYNYFETTNGESIWNADVTAFEESFYRNTFYYFGGMTSCAWIVEGRDGRATAAYLADSADAAPVTVSPSQPADSLLMQGGATLSALASETPDCPYLSTYPVADAAEYWGFSTVTTTAASAAAPAQNGAVKAGVPQRAAVRTDADIADTDFDDAGLANENPVLAELFQDMETLAEDYDENTPPEKILSDVTFLGLDATVKYLGTPVIVLTVLMILVSLVWCFTGFKTYPVFSAIKLLLVLNFPTITELMLRITGLQDIFAEPIHTPVLAKIILFLFSAVLAVFCFKWKKFAAFVMLYADTYPVLSLLGWLLSGRQVLADGIGSWGSLLNSEGTLPNAGSIMLTAALLTSVAAAGALILGVLGAVYKKPFLIVSSALTFGCRAGYLLSALIMRTTKPSVLTFALAVLLSIGGFIVQVKLGHGFFEKKKAQADDKQQPVPAPESVPVPAPAPVPAPQVPFAPAYGGMPMPNEAAQMPQPGFEPPAAPAPAALYVQRPQMQPRTQLKITMPMQENLPQNPAEGSAEPAEEPVQHRFCIECGKMIPADSEFCTECGAPQKLAEPVTENAPETPQPEAQPEPETAPMADETPAEELVQHRFCIECGKMIPADSEFCTECGASQNMAEPVTANAPETPQPEAQPESEVQPEPETAPEASETPAETAAEAPAAEPAEEVAAPAPVVCVKCGQPLEAGAGFCTECGAKQPVPETESAAKPETPAAEKPAPPQRSGQQSKKRSKNKKKRGDQTPRSREGRTGGPVIHMAKGRNKGESGLVMNIKNQKISSSGEGVYDTDDDL